MILDFKNYENHIYIKLSLYNAPNLLSPLALLIEELPVLFLSLPLQLPGQRDAVIVFRWTSKGCDTPRGCLEKPGQVSQVGEGSETELLP